MEFMREGGPVMIVTLLVGLGMLGLAFSRRENGGDRLALTGAILCLCLGAVGFSLGVAATAQYITAQATPDAVLGQILAQGMKESSNNTLLGGILALVLGVSSLVLRPAVRS